MSTDARTTSLTTSCRQTLTDWGAPGPDQEVLRRLYLEHLDHHPDGWARECPGVHLTASSLICSPGEQRVLLTLHAKLRRWLQTGGHVEPGDTSLAAAAHREAAEESGLARLTLDEEPLLLSRHPLTCGGRPTHHLDVQFLVVAPAGTVPVVGEESLDVRWFSTSDLPEVDQSVHDLVGAAGRRLGWS
jgi:8-oxo-dGTP pyrophosphatase MutT (NUDIX family)